ncbi:MAG: DUF2828 domain-containing protein [Gammaproteobacteria bacterium]|nr:DUF2828 domain-containing protein [Gammaproteobacteria bacterium]
MPKNTSSKKSPLISAIEKKQNKTRTTNGAKAYRSTGSDLMDFFSRGGAIRELSSAEQVRLFANAWLESPTYALRALFYFRDIRQGQGQREPFRQQLAYLARVSEENVLHLLGIVPEYGRWDDLLCCLDISPRITDEIITLIAYQLKEDDQAEHPSLLAKWLPSENASSEKTKYYATKIRKAIGFAPKQYRKLLSKLRAKINIVESKMSANKWDDIDYSKVPSQAFRIYTKAFYRHDEAGFTKFLSDVSTGKTKVNAGAMYPYQLVSKALDFDCECGSTEDKSLTAQWDALPDYVEDKEASALCVVDTSGSMRGQPMEVALSLGMYFAERNTGPFKDNFITFSQHPKLQNIKGNTLCAKVRNMVRADWDMNTDLEKVFELILRTAVTHNLKQKDLPNKIIIISDMQFDSVKNGKNKTLFKTAKKMFKENKYKLPEVVFWNVKGVHDNHPVKQDENGTQLISGFSPTVFKYILTNKMQTPEEQMFEILDSPRYAHLKAISTS